MKDLVKILLGIVVLGVLVGISVYFYNNTIGKEESNTYEEPEVEEIVEEKEETVVDNTVEEDEPIASSENENVTTTVLAQNTGSQIYELTSDDIGSTSKKEDAIAIVKKKWGEDDTVSFVCDHVTNEGEYVIAVVSKSNAEVLNYFRVSVDDNTATVEY